MRMKSVLKYGTRALVLMTLLSLTMVAIGFGVFTKQVANAEIPVAPNSMEEEKPITIYASDGVTKIATLQPPDGVRTVVPSYKVSDNMKDALVSAEDRTFWDNYGFSFIGTARAAVDQARNVPGAGGGSGITQQLVKNTLVGNEHSLERKWKELVSSTKLTAAWTKDDIITSYLNIIYFGRGALGVEEAAQAYFNVSAAELDKSQSALLAGVIQAPSQHDPFINPDSAHARFEYVKDQMLRNGFITQEEYDNMEFPEVAEYTGPKSSTGTDGANGHIVTQALEELEAQGYTKDKLHSVGASVITTIDMNVQNKVVETGQNASANHGVSVGIATIDPKTGAVRGIYGGDDGYGYDLSKAPQMTGSTFKTFALASALDQGASLDEQIDSSNYSVNGVVTRNSGGQQSGMISLREATKQSLNTVFYRLQAQYGGPESTREYAQRLGVDATLSEDDGTVAQSIVLGSYGTSPLQLASGYATIANDGMRNDRHIVDRVKTSNGQQIMKVNTHPIQVIPSAVTRGIDSALAPIAEYSNNNQLGGGKFGYMKTGTVALNDYSNRDALSAGYTDNAATAVWVGTKQPGEALVSPIEGPIWGAGLPSRIWRDIMTEIG